MKLSDLDPCLWQPPNQTYDQQQPSTSTTTLLNYDYQSGGGGELSENYTELKPLPSSVFEYTTNLNQYDVSTTTSNIKTELVEYLLTSDIDDIAALIGSAIAETQQVPEPVSSSTSNNNVDPWTELDQWIENACQLNSTGVVGSDNNGETTTADYILPSIVNDYNFNNTNSPILQARLQSSSTLSTITTPQQQQNQNQLPESTSNNTRNYGLLKIEPNYNVLIESNTSPTVSSTSVLINQRFNSNNSNHLNTNNKKINNGSFNSNKFSEQKQKKNRNNNNINKNKSSLSTIELTSDKEKPIHRCSICNRGFLNKSNIKVHLRTHTGEKPFKCEVCGKAFRQKAHLLKHVQIHKRITRD